ncbi:4-aminobutyrate--2-oxoglutarate transaminase [Acetobacter estunensis]|uniref:4-aminobutyrate--2-oxoglutarate transaminase n=1 Tax=Acetobacter estunensis TaxID=104097 RepID=UPI001C2D10EB|nr:4-aminobutyrate--2-oxoglutarate transaminase [Acetobacter estunensis]
MSTGKSNAALAARRAAAVPVGVGSATSIYADRAQGAELWDVEGRRIVDFAAGIAVVNVGHRHPRIIAAVEAQLGRFSHTGFQVAPYESYIELAERLNALAPIDGPAKSIFFTTGAEATENAVKIARAATGRSGVIAFTGGFHGRTLLASAMTGKVNPYKTQFGTMPGDVFHAPFPARGISVADSLRTLDLMFAADVDPSRVAAIIIEPIQGEGGFRVVPEELLKGLRERCTKHGILLIADEVQTGFARTGKLFGIQHSSVKPDLISVAKALGGGFPLSGVVGRAEIMDAVRPGGLGGTYGGSPLACAAGLAVLDVIESEKLCERAEHIGRIISERVAGWSERSDLIPVGKAHGRGAMVGFDVLKARGTDEVEAGGASKVCAAAVEAGVIVLSCGVLGETVRLLPPLTISDAVLNEGLDLLEKALKA